jgi:hypothetical protein
MLHEQAHPVVRMYFSSFESSSKSPHIKTVTKRQDELNLDVNPAKHLPPL